MVEQRVRGAKVQGDALVDKNAHTPSSFWAVWDSDGYFQPGSSDEVLTISRPKRRGRYQIRVAVRWENPWSLAGGPLPTYDEFAAMYYYTYITVNGGLLGNEARATASPVISAAGTTQYFATDANLSLGDSVGVSLWQSVGTKVNATVFLEIRRLGRRIGARAIAMPNPLDPTAEMG